MVKTMKRILFGIVSFIAVLMVIVSPAYADENPYTGLYAVRQNQLGKVNVDNGSFTILESIGSEIGDDSTSWDNKVEDADWAGTTAMATDGKQHLYLAQQSSIWDVNLSTNRYTLLGKKDDCIDVEPIEGIEDIEDIEDCVATEDWIDIEAMVFDQEKSNLYVIDNGELWKVSLQTKDAFPLGDHGWYDTQGMIIDNDFLYIEQGFERQRVSLSELSEWEQESSDEFETLLEECNFNPDAPETCTDGSDCKWDELQNELDDLPQFPSSYPIRKAYDKTDAFVPYRHYLLSVEHDTLFLVDESIPDFERKKMSTNVFRGTDAMSVYNDQLYLVSQGYLLKLDLTAVDLRTLNDDGWIETPCEEVGSGIQCKSNETEYLVIIDRPLDEDDNWLGTDAMVAIDSPPSDKNVSSNTSATSGASGEALSMDSLTSFNEDIMPVPQINSLCISIIQGDAQKSFNKGFWKRNNKRQLICKQGTTNKPRGQFVTKIKCRIQLSNGKVYSGYRVGKNDDYCTNVGSLIPS